MRSVAFAAAAVAVAAVGLAAASCSPQPSGTAPPSGDFPTDAGPISGDAGGAKVRCAPVEEPVPDIGGYVGANLSSTCEWSGNSTPMNGTVVTLTGGGQLQTTTVDANGCFWFDVPAPGQWQISAPPQSGSRSLACDSDVSSTLGTVTVTLSAGATSWDNRFGYQ
jgi:hypothetical protein